MYDLDGNIQQHFEKVKDAIEFLIEEGSLNETCRYSIGRDLAQAFLGERQIVCGHRWSYYGESIPPTKKSSSKKEVYLIDKDTLEPVRHFFSCGDAAKFLGCQTSTLARHCRGENDKCMNQLLCYVEDYEKRKKTWEENKTTINLNRNIYIYKGDELVATTETYADAAYFVGKTRRSSLVSKVIDTNRTYLGYTFKRKP